ncbi:hypothetical protein ACJX0J_026045, partial [Zea mays]
AAAYELSTSHFSEVQDAGAAIVAARATIFIFLETKIGVLPVGFAQMILNISMRSARGDAHVFTGLERKSAKTRDLFPNIGLEREQKNERERRKIKRQDKKI